MSFKKYVPGISRSIVPTVSVRTNGVIGFNSAAVREWPNCFKKKYVTLHYDKQGNRVGIKFTNDQDEIGTLKLIAKKRPGNVYVSGAGLFKQIGVDYSELKHFPIVLGHNYMLIFTLSGDEEERE